jgi:hypothetical protein
MQVAHCDYHQALSFDRLHFNHGGLFADHIWMQLKRHVESLGRHAITQVDQKLVSSAVTITLYHQLRFHL